MSKHLFSIAAVAGALFLFPGASRSCAREPELVDIETVDPTILVDLRYASARNIAKRPIYFANMPALTRPHVAAQLAEAQAALRARGYGLKIWDAYRPQRAQEELWKVAPNDDYVADPHLRGGSLHTCGVAVDATLVDSQGRDVAMPTDFDDFTPGAMLKYTGGDPLIWGNLRTLQRAMGRAGFYGMRTEWWHFIAKDWRRYRPIPKVILVAAGTTKRRWDEYALRPEPAAGQAVVRRGSPPPSAGNPADPALSGSR